MEEKFDKYKLSTFEFDRIRGCIFFMNNSFFGIWWQRILHEENRRRNRRIEQLKWMGFSMKLWLKLKIFLTFKWRFSSFIQIEVLRSYKISYIIGATGSDRKQKPVQYFHFFFNQMIWEQLWWIQVRKFKNIMVVILFLSLGALRLVFWVLN